MTYMWTEPNIFSEIYMALLLDLSYIPIRLSNFLLEPSRKIVMGLEAVFYGFGLWKMKFLNIPLIFAGFVLLGRCLPTTYCTIYHAFKRMKEEQGLLIQQKKSWMQQGLNPWFQGERAAPKPQGLVDIVDMILPFGWTCHVWILTELATLQTSQADICKVCKPHLWTWCHHALVFS